MDFDGNVDVMTRSASSELTDSKFVSSYTWIRESRSQDTDGLAYAALIALSGLIVATSLAVVLVALEQLGWMEWRFDEFLKVLEHARRLPNVE